MTLDEFKTLVNEGYVTDISMAKMYLDDESKLKDLTPGDLFKTSAITLTSHKYSDQKIQENVNDVDVDVNDVDVDVDVNDVVDVNKNDDKKKDENVNQKTSKKTQSKKTEEVIVPNEDESEKDLEIVVDDGKDE